MNDCRNADRPQDTERLCMTVQERRAVNATERTKRFTVCKAHGEPFCLGGRRALGKTTTSVNYYCM